MTFTSRDEQDSRDMARLASGQDAALNDLMERHSRKVYQYLLRSLQNEDDAADLAQETFVRVYSNRTRFNPKQSFKTWLYAIASNLIRDRFRWRSRHAHVSIDAEQPESESGLKNSLPGSEGTPDEHLQGSERANAVKQALGALPDELREPLILSVYEGLSHGEIGEILDCSAKAVETRIYRARNQLRERLLKTL